MRWNHLQQVVFCLWAILFGILMLIGIGLTLLFPFPAKAHVMDHPEWNEWLSAQRTPDGNNYSCCNRSDAYLLDDEDVRVVDGDYEAKIEGEWIKFPNTGEGNKGNTVLGAVGNPTGGAIAWAFHGRAYCFAPGTYS